MSEVHDYGILCKSFLQNSLKHIQLTLNKKEIRCNGTNLTSKLVYGVLRQDENLEKKKFFFFFLGRLPLLPETNNFSP